MKSAEEIAREAAEKLVCVCEVGPHSGMWVVHVGPSVATSPQNKIGAEPRATRCVEHLADGILAAIREDRGRVVGGEPPIGRGRMEEIRSFHEHSLDLLLARFGLTDVNEARSGFTSYEQDANSDLLVLAEWQDATIAELSRIVALMQNDSGQWQAGHETGVREGLRLAKEAARKRMEGYVEAAELTGLLDAIDAAAPS